MGNIIDQLTDVDVSGEYSLSGKTINCWQEIMRSLWRGDHIGKSPYVRKKQHGNGGFTLDIDASADVTEPVTYDPFQIFASKHLVGGIWDGSTYDVTVYPGSVNGLIPTNLPGTITQGINSTQYVILTCQSNGYGVTSSGWDLESDQPSSVDASADMPPSTFYIPLGVIFYDGTTNSISVYQIVNYNISAQPAEWTRTTRAGAGPFELAYVIYYYWIFGNDPFQTVGP